jgi:mevalonate kinase
MTEQPITASAPGKIHFIGEHTAVYGKPAILAAIDKRCTVTLEPLDGGEIKITSKNFNKTVRLSIPEVLAIRDDAQAKWEKYRELNDITILKGIIRNEVMYPVAAIGETFRYFKKIPSTGFHLTIDSQIPIGSGHGSSAAVAVSIVGAVTKFLDETIDTAIISKIAIRVEQKKHGNPSYGDVGAVVHGGLIWFHKETPDMITIKELGFELPKKFSENIVIIQSGIPEESTGEMVHIAAEFRKSHGALFEEVLRDQEQLTYQLCEAFRTADEESLLHIIKNSEKNLEVLGVVSPFAMSLIRDIEKFGGAAKICGAGGKANGSGIILAYHKERKVVESFAKKKQLSYYTAVLGGEGLQIN